MSRPDPAPVTVDAEVAPPADRPPVDPTMPPGLPPFWAFTPLPPARPRWGRTRRWCLVVALAGVFVLAASAVVAVQTFRDSRTPQAAVRAYFGALSRGDAAGALAAGTAPAGGRALVSDAVLTATVAAAPIDDVTTGAVSMQGDQASVAVRYRLGGSSPQQVDDTVALTHVDGRWRLQHSAVPVVITLDAATWAAVPSRPPFTVPTDIQLVFPGPVPVLYRTPLLAVAAGSRVVRLGATHDLLGVTAEVTTAGRETALRTVVAALTACAKGGSDVDPFCPQPPPGRADDVVLRAVPGSFTGDLPGLDRLDLDVVVDPAASGTLAVSGSVEVDGTWQVLDYDNVAQDRSGTATMTFSASVALGGPGTLTWARA